MSTAVAEKVSESRSWSPQQEQAIKLTIILEDRPVTRRDFKHLGLSPSRWTDPYTGWLQSTEHGYVAGPKLPDFKAQHPRNYVEIKADKSKWMPSDLAVIPKTVKPAVASSAAAQGTLPFNNDSVESIANV